MATSFTLQQVLDLQWFATEGYEVRVTEDGKIFYKDPDYRVKAGNDAELDVTNLFFANTEPATRLGDRFSDFAYERYCPACESFCDPSDIQDIDSDFSPHLPNQMRGLLQRRQRRYGRRIHQERT